MEIPIYSKDYHDYVFKNGRLIGDFDNMYQNSEEVPWHQDIHADSWFNKIGFLMLKDKAPYKNILEIGCGLGYIAQKLTQLTPDYVDAIDISLTAIYKAREIHKNKKINFFVGDITSKDFLLPSTYGLVVIKDVFWYVFDCMETVLGNIDQCLSSGTYLYINQSFPSLDTNFVGKEIIDSPERLIGYFSTRYEPIYKIVVQRYESVDDGPLLHYLGVKK